MTADSKIANQNNTTTQTPTSYELKRQQWVQDALSGKTPPPTYGSALYVDYLKAKTKAGRATTGEKAQVKSYEKYGDISRVHDTVTTAKGVDSKGNVIIVRNVDKDTYETTMASPDSQAKLNTLISLGIYPKDTKYIDAEQFNKEYGTNLTSPYILASNQEAINKTIYQHGATKQLEQKGAIKDDKSLDVMKAAELGIKHKTLVQAGYNIAQVDYGKAVAAAVAQGKTFTQKQLTGIGIGTEVASNVYDLQKMRELNVFSEAEDKQGFNIDFATGVASGYDWNKIKNTLSVAGIKLGAETQKAYEQAKSDSEAWNIVSEKLDTKGEIGYAGIRGALTAGVTQEQLKRMGISNDFIKAALASRTTELLIPSYGQPKEKEGETTEVEADLASSGKYAGYGAGIDYFTRSRKEGYIPTIQEFRANNPGMTSGELIDSYESKYGDIETTNWGGWKYENTPTTQLLIEQADLEREANKPTPPTLQPQALPTAPQSEKEKEQYMEAEKAVAAAWVDYGEELRALKPPVGLQTFQAQFLQGYLDNILADQAGYTTQQIEGMSQSEKFKAVANQKNWTPEQREGLRQQLKTQAEGEYIRLYGSGEHIGASFVSAGEMVGVPFVKLATPEFSLKDAGPGYIATEALKGYLWAGMPGAGKALGLAGPGVQKVPVIKKLFTKSGSLTDDAIIIAAANQAEGIGYRTGSVATRELTEGFAGDILTPAMKSELSNLGYSGAQVSAMSPTKALDLIRNAQVRIQTVIGKSGTFPTHYEVIKVSTPMGEIKVPEITYTEYKAIRGWEGKAPITSVKPEAGKYFLTDMEELPNGQFRLNFSKKEPSGKITTTESATVSKKSSEDILGKMGLTDDEIDSMFSFSQAKKVKEPSGTTQVEATGDIEIGTGVAVAERPKISGGTGTGAYTQSTEATHLVWAQTPDGMWYPKISVYPITSPGQIPTPDISSGAEMAPLVRTEQPTIITTPSVDFSKITIEAHEDLSKIVPAPREKPIGEVIPAEETKGKTKIETEPTTEPAPSTFPVPAFGSSEEDKVSVRDTIPPKEPVPVVPPWLKLPEVSLGGGGGYQKHGLHSTYIKRSQVIPELVVYLPEWKGIKPPKMDNKLWGKLGRMPQGVELLGEEEFEDTPFGRKAVRTVVGRAKISAGAKQLGSSLKPKMITRNSKISYTTSPRAMGDLGL